MKNKENGPFMGGREQGEGLSNNCVCVSKRLKRLTNEEQHCYIFLLIKQNTFLDSL